MNKNPTGVDVDVYEVGINHTSIISAKVSYGEHEVYFEAPIPENYDDEKVKQLVTALLSSSRMETK